MIAYLFIIILLLCLSLKFDFKGTTKKRDSWGYFALVLLILLAGFRGDIGNDTIVYHRWYDFLSTNIGASIRDSRFEPLFVICCCLAKSIGCSWLVVQLLIAAWINYYMFSFIRRYCSMLFLPLLLYFISMFYFLNCEELRGAIGFGFILMGLPYIEQKNYFKYFLMVLIGCGFHYGNALFIILPFIPNIFKSKILLVIVLGIGFIGANILQARFGMYAMLIDSFLGVDTVSSYADGDYTDASGKSIMNLINIFITGVFFPLLAYLISKQDNKSLEKIFIFYIFCIIGSMALPLFYRYNHQLAIVGNVTLCLALSTAFKTKNILPKLVVVLCLLISIYGSISTYLTYNSFLDGYFYENFIPYTIYDF